MFGWLRKKSSSVDVDARTLQAMATRGAATIVDVREPGEFASGHIAGAINRPMSRFVPEHAPVSADGELIVFVCQTGVRAAAARHAVAALGRGDARLLTGGLAGWRRAGFDLSD